jgi:hypothetical protein
MAHKSQPKSARTCALILCEKKPIMAHAQRESMKMLSKMPVRVTKTDFDDDDDDVGVGVDVDVDVDVDVELTRIDFRDHFNAPPNEANQEHSDKG